MSGSLLSFLLLEGAWDKAEEWTQLSASQRANIKAQYAAAGIKLMISVFGSTDVPTSIGADPIATANTIAAWAKQFDMDGVDVDYEVMISCFPSMYCSCLSLPLRTSMPSMQAMVVPRTGLSPSRSSFDPNFLKDSLLLPTPVREPPSHEIVI